MKYPTPANLSVQPSDQEYAREQQVEQILRYLSLRGGAIHQVYGEFYCRVERFYLDGFKLIDVLDQELFLELSGLLGGQCYEAAALAMLVLRENPTARLVYGTAVNSPDTGGRCDHAWVEFTAHGLPFVVDWTWFPDDVCLPRLIHQDSRQPIAISSISYQEFWASAFTRRLHQNLQDAGHSYAYPWLIFWRTAESEYQPVLWRRLAHFGGLNGKALRGQRNDYWYFFDLLLKNQRSVRIPELALIT